jgi:hypothetical protein
MTEIEVKVYVQAQLIVGGLKRGSIIIKLLYLTQDYYCCQIKLPCCPVTILSAGSVG